MCDMGEYTWIRPSIEASLSGPREKQIQRVMITGKQKPWIEEPVQNNGSQVFLESGKVFPKFETYSQFKNREILKDREVYVMSWIEETGKET